MSVRANFGNLAQNWRGLTEDERRQWEGESINFQQTDVFGSSFKYTGFNLFMFINRWRQTIGLNFTNTPPNPTAVTNSIVTDVQADGTLDTIKAVFSPTVAANHKVAVYATPPVSAGKKFTKSFYRLVKILNAGATSPADITTEYKARFGSIAGKAGMKIAIKFVTVTDSGIPGIESSAINIIS
jgi:hypothetical protein